MNFMRMRIFSLSVRCDGPEFVRQYLQRLSTRCELGMRTCEIALGVHTTCRVS